jgi:Zn-dependent alcohol dehydrogenase
MAKTMKAAVVREFSKPLVIEEVAIPEPGPEEIQLKDGGMRRMSYRSSRRRR